MLADFEARLANVLGTRLPAPFAGRVRVIPEVPAGAGPAVQVGVVTATPIDEDFTSRRHELLPSETQSRRVVRLRCDVDIDVTPAGGQGRAQELAGIDRLLFLLDDGELRDGTALVAADDQGFLVEEMTIVETVPPTITLSARGWFWPVGEPGVDGPEIDRMIVRQAVLPIALRPPGGRLTAGGPATELGLVLGGTAGVLLEADQPTAPALFGSLAVGLSGDGGQPGAGTLSGGDAGPDGRRVVPVTGGAAAVTYQPPVAAGTDHLVVSMFVVDGDGVERVGIELSRFPLVVEAAP